MQLRGIWIYEYRKVSLFPFYIYICPVLVFKSLRKNYWNNFLFIGTLRIVMALRSMQMFGITPSRYLKISYSPYCKPECVNKRMCILAILASDFLFSAALFTLPQLFSLEMFQWCTINLFPLWKYSGYFCNIRKHHKNLICLSVDMKKYTLKGTIFLFLSQTVAFCWIGLTTNHPKKTKTKKLFEDSIYSNLLCANRNTTSSG